MGGEVMRRHGAIALVLLSASVLLAADAPKDVGLKEQVTVSLVPLEVTVWPKNGQPDACAGLTIDDFDLRVDRKAQAIYAVDVLGENDETYMRDAAAARVGGRGGMSLVLFFDLWHLNVFYKDFSGCPPTKPLAFDEARRYVREQLHDGDRLLLVTAAGWPVVRYGWLSTQADALAALDRLEHDRQVMAPRQEHLHHNGWIAGIESLFLALGRYPGRKDVLYLADDFRFDDVAIRMYEIAARAQANGVVVSSVDLLDTCRKLPGPPCSQDAVGLACTEFSHPVALGPLASETGGNFFPAHSIANAVHDIRAMRSCRYLVSFKKEPAKGKRAPTIDLVLKGPRAKSLTLRAPSSYETEVNAPSRAENDDARFLLPKFGRGLSAEVALWPYRPAAKGGRWSAFVMAHVDRTDDEPWPDELTELKLTLLTHKQSKVYGQYTKRIAGADLAAFKNRGTTGSLLFPVDGIQPGQTTVDLTATADVEDLSANASASIEIPPPPAAGEAGPWFLSDHLERVGSRAVLAPSYDGIVAPGEFLSIVGYACPPKGTVPESYAASLVPLAGGSPFALALSWLERPGSASACGWLAGRVTSALAPGLWSLEPPKELGSRAASPPAPFNVIPPEGADGVARVGTRQE